MVRSLSAEPILTEAEAALLLDLAELAIRSRLEGTCFAGADTHLLPEALQRPCSAFVSLHVDGQLNGCIGNIGGAEPVGACVVRLALQAAFEDPRLPALRRAEVDALVIEISLLSPLTPVPSTTRDDVLAHLEPGIHGLVLSARGARAVFLPTVWDQLPEPDEFVAHLLRKAGLPGTGWPSGTSAEVFTTVSVERPLG